MTDMTSEQYRELANLCRTTQKDLARIGREVPWGEAENLAKGTGFDVAMRFLRAKAQEAEKREDAERQLREDIAGLMNVPLSESGVPGTVDAIIRRVREADKG